MNGDESTVTRIERLHELATLEEVDLEAQYGEALKIWLTEFITAELPGSPAPPVSTPKEFAKAIDHLARNKRAWSQRLGSMVIELSDCETSETEMEATARLKQFIQQCPWKYLRDSANRKL